MNTLRRILVLLAALGVVVMLSAPLAAAIPASPVRVGESSQTSIDVFTSVTPSFAAAPPSGLSVSFSTPAEVAATNWQVTMTIAATTIAPGQYSFPLTVSGPQGVLLTDTVVVDVSPAATTTTTTSLPPTTSTTTTTTTLPPTTSTTTTSTTATTRPAPTTTSTTTSTTATSTTTATTTTTTTSTTTTTPPTTAPPATEPPATQPTTTRPPSAAAEGPPGAALDPGGAPPLGVLLPLGVLAVAVLWSVIVAARRRRAFTPASHGRFGA